MRRLNLHSLLLIFLLAHAGITHAADRNNYTIRKATERIRIDGSLDEPSWKNGADASEFRQKFPFDTSAAVSKSRVKILFDQDFIYFGIECTNRDTSSPFVVQTLRRDFDPAANDAFQIIIDPFNDQYNGFSFIVSPYNVQSEGLITGGGTFGQSSNWDNRWFSQVSRSKNAWYAEVAIPFASIRFNPNTTVWGLNLARIDLKHNEISVWNPVPRNFNLTSLAFTGNLAWETAPPASGLNVSVIPYGVAEANQDIENNQAVKTRPALGADAKIAVTSSLNLDLTVNPDFSQADVDRQITNLTRFSLFFPERRQFFLENNDLFAQFGFSKIRPFFSRRIGLQDGVRIPIRYGLRLSGKVNRDWRIGLLNMQTGSSELLGIPSENFTVACFQRQLKGRSNIGGIFVNRQETDANSLKYTRFNRVAGIDYKLASKNGRWNGIAFFHKSFSPGKPQKEEYAHASFLRYDDANWSLMWNHEYVGKNYNAAAGFVPRQEQYNAELGKTIKASYWRLEPEISYRYYFKSEKLNSIEFSAYSSAYADSAYTPTEIDGSLSVQTNYVNTAYWGINYSEKLVRLIYPQDITLSNLAPLPAGNYRFNEISVYGRSDVRKRVTVSGAAGIGSFYTGKKQSVSSVLQWRFPPYATLGINYSLDAIQLGGEYAPVVLNLIGPQVDWSFSRSLFFSTIVQYNDQSGNMNWFARLQWRFKPMSDMFLVFTNNYGTPNLNAKNWALIAKVSLWISP